jgi:murein DD-endopeptidase MepM/ murein hydrolase activator NlpD
MIKLKNILVEDASNLLQTFPIGSKNFNVGYDAETMGVGGKELTRDKAVHNSDYGSGDVAHASRGGHRGIDIFAPKGEPVVAPVTGTVVAINDSLSNSPETINSDPYGAGWLAKIEVAAAPSDLLTAAQYGEITA